MNSALPIVATVLLIIFGLIIPVAFSRELRNDIYAAKALYGITLNPVKAAFIYHHTKFPNMDDHFGKLDVFFYAPAQIVGQFFVYKHEDEPKENWGMKLKAKYADRHWES
jgi:hypothetical protein